jgi:hypothetical protein
MKPRIILSVLMLVLVALPLGAQTWKVYDNFDGPLLNPARWYSEYGEDRSALEYGRQIRNSCLELWMRAYGRTDLSGGQTQGINSMLMLDMTSFKGMRAKLTVTKLIFNDGPDPGSYHGFEIRSSFFNSGTSEPIDDVSATIGIGEQDGKLWVSGNVLCGRYPEGLGGVVLGSIKIGEPINIWIRWDSVSKQFFFGLQSLRRNQPPVEQGITCTVPDAIPPVDHIHASMGLGTWLNNSMSFQAYSELMVKIDQVSVLRGTL